MKRMILSLVFALAATTAFAQFTFDENGNGFGPGGVPIPGIIGIDPLTGTNALCYPLPFPTAPGDVLITETEGLTNRISDVLRFVQNNLYVYSERELNEIGADLADVLAFPPLQPNIAGPFSETGVEGNNGFIWAPVPGSGMPGDPGFAVQYTFISDIPEPAGVLLTSIGLAGLCVLIRRKKPQP